MDQDCTILRHGTQWELRYLTKVPHFQLIVWHDSNVFSEVRVPAVPGEWQTVTAKWTPDKMMIEANGEKASGVPKEAIRMEANPPSLFVGASTPRPVDGAMQRPFVGAVADIRVNAE